MRDSDRPGVTSFVHVGLVVEDLDATTRFLALLGFDCGKPGVLSGEWIDRIIGLENVTVEVVMARAPDGSDMFEVVRFHSPSAGAQEPARAANRPGLRHVAFKVDDVRSVVDRVREAGWDTIGEIVDYENTFLLCYVRGPEGLIVELAERLDGGPAEELSSTQRQEMTAEADVLVAGSAGYESARKSQIARFDGVRPHAVARCRMPEDVAQALALARREGLHVALRSGGHCFAGRSSTTGVVIDVSGMDEVSVSDGTVTVGAGARLADVYDALAAHDRTIAAGCGPTVGIAGLTLGGGLGILGRSHGLTADQVIAARAVLADGRIVDCDEHRHEDLFWALRGAGGGQFAAVTQLVLRTLPAPKAKGFHLVWPWTVGAAVVGAWQAWAPEAPDAIAASLLVRAPTDSNLPPIVTVFGAVLGQQSAAQAALDEFIARVGAAPSKANYAPGPYGEIKRYLAEYDICSGQRRPVEREAGHSYSKSEYFRRELPADAIAELLARFAHGRQQREARVLDFTPWAGAYNRVPADATAFAHRAERFLLKQEVVVDAGASEAERQAAREWVSQSWALAHAWGTGGVYPNFPDPELEDFGCAYHGGNLDRLRRVKATYDPENVFKFDQSVQPT